MLDTVENEVQKESDNIECIQVVALERLQLMSIQLLLVVNIQVYSCILWLTS